jgi:hypothetical protein
MSFETNTDTANIIPNVAIKIKEMSYLKQTYLRYIIELFPFLSNSSQLSFYANPLIILLQNLINIHKTEILFELEDALTSVLITYIFDIDDLIKGYLDLKKYEPRHNNLMAVHQQVDYHLKHDDRAGLAELKATLFLI